MGKVKRHKLSLDISIDFELIGICSHHSDYRLAFAINQQLELHLAKDDTLAVYNYKKTAGTISQDTSSHSFHYWQDEDENIEYYLVKNKKDSRYLFPEKAQIDYFLMLREEPSIDMEQLCEGLKKIPIVVAAFNFDPEKLPSSGFIVFEESVNSN